MVLDALASEYKVMGYGSASRLVSPVELLFPCPGRPARLPSECFIENDKTDVYFAIRKAFFPDWRRAQHFRAKCGAITLHKTHNPNELLRVLERIECSLGWYPSEEVEAQARP